MYRIKPKQGYNVFIKDLNISLKSNQENWRHVSKEDFEKSANIKSVLHLIIVEEDDSIQEGTLLETPKLITSVIEKENNIFVSDGRVYKNPDNVFIKNPEHIVDVIETKKEDKLEGTLVEETDEEDLVVEEIIEEIIEEKATEETIQEIREEIIEENEELNDVEAKGEEKPRRGRPPKK